MHRTASQLHPAPGSTFVQRLREARGRRRGVERAGAGVGGTLLCLCLFGLTSLGAPGSFPLQIWGSWATRRPHREGPCLPSGPADSLATSLLSRLHLPRCLSLLLSALLRWAQLPSMALWTAAARGSNDEVVRLLAAKPINPNPYSHHPPCSRRSRLLRLNCDQDLTPDPNP